MPNKDIVADGVKLLEALLGPCEGTDDHSWRDCRRCIAMHGLENRFPLSIQVLTQLLDAQKEITRLKTGHFTKDEIHTICHNLHGTVSAQEFADGCAKEQIKLYGYCPDRGKIVTLQQEITRLRQVLNDVHDRLAVMLKELWPS